MINLLDILQDAERENTNELRVASGQRPSIRTRKGWHPLQQENLAPAFVREQILSLLDEEERVQLLERGVTNGSLQLKEKRFTYVFSRSAQGFNAYFSWKSLSVELSDFALPPSVLEIFRKSTGVNIITGPRQSGRSTLAQLLSQEVSEKGLRSVAVFADQTEEYADLANENSWQIFSTEQLATSSQICCGFDFIVVDSQRTQGWKQAINLAEAGQRVILVLPFTSAKTAIERLSERLEGSPEIGRRRLALTIQMVLSLRLIPAVEKGLQSAYELLLLTKEIRQAIESNAWHEIETLMSTGGETSGMRTLNQCLMNLMMRRKIDVKAGFAESPHPQELDQMLEKVGF